MAEYSQALQLDPKFAGACWGRGDCLLAQVRAPPSLCLRERAAALSGRAVRRGISTPALRSSQLRWPRTPTTSERILAGQSACGAKGSCARQKCVAPNPKHTRRSHTDLFRPGAARSTCGRRWSWTRSARIRASCWTNSRTRFRSSTRSAIVATAPGWVPAAMAARRRRRRRSRHNYRTTGRTSRRDATSRSRPMPLPGHSSSRSSNSNSR